MRASQISVGNELLIGDTVNTNASWIGARLAEIGVACHRVLTVGDDAASIRHALDLSFSDSDLVLLTGGLGPTHDDLTKSALASYFGVGYVRHEASYARIRRHFEYRGIPFSASNETQADLPANALALPNSQGSAPGMWIEHDGTILVAMPGVPREMKAIIDEEVLPRLLARSGHDRLAKSYVQIAGIGESTLSDVVIGDVSRFLTEGVSLAYLPHTHGITLRVTSLNGSAESAEGLLRHIRTAAADFIVGEGAGATLELAVVNALSARGLTLATAESCTGGWMSNLVTNVPGSSAVFMGGVVAYHNEVKRSMLGVPQSVLTDHGAVSKETALAMAEQVARRLGADIGVSTTGVAGPSGGTEAKPVGTVWIGFWTEHRRFAVRARLFKDRLLNKERTAVLALDILRRHLLGIPGMPYDLVPDS